jgi:hypothetical protein
MAVIFIKTHITVYPVNIMKKILRVIKEYGIFDVSRL